MSVLQFPLVHRLVQQRTDWVAAIKKNVALLSGPSQKDGEAVLISQKKQVAERRAQFCEQ